VNSLSFHLVQKSPVRSQARVERKAKLQAKIDNLNTKLQIKLDQVKQRSDQIKGETDAKVQALQQKAAKAQGDAKKAIDARIAQLRGEYEERSRRLRSLAAEQLRKAAAQIER
jgi:hypothetical protein